MSSASTYHAEFERLRQQRLLVQHGVGQCLQPQNLQTAEGGEDLEQNMDRTGVCQPAALLRQRLFEAGGRQERVEHLEGGFSQGVARHQAAPASRYE